LVVVEFEVLSGISQMPQDRCTNRDFNLLYPRFLNQLLLLGGLPSLYHYASV